MSWWFARSLTSSTWPVTEFKNLYSQLKYIDWQFLAKRLRVQIVWRAIQAGPSVLRTDYMPWIFRHIWNSGVELSLSKQAQALLQLRLRWFWHGYNHYVLKARTPVSCSLNCVHLYPCTCRQNNFRQFDFFAQQGGLIADNFFVAGLAKLIKK